VKHPQRYPLDWPAQYPRTRVDKRVRGTFRCSFSTALEELLLSLERRGVEPDDIVVSTNIPTRLDGLPRANLRHDGDDTGAAVYWRGENGETLCMACDKYDTVLGNLRALGLTLEALRAIDRYASSAMIEATYSGFKALSAQGATDWWRVLGFDAPPANYETVRFAYRAKIAAAHPDKLGESFTERAADLNAAHDAARVYYDA